MASLEERKLLSDELKGKIAAAETMAVLEAFYLPSAQAADTAR